MVTWIVGSSGDQGSVGGYIRAVAAPGTQPIRANYSSNGYKLASSGSVDVNAVTRFQVQVPSQGVPSFGGGANFNFSAADITANPGKNLTGTAFIAPASAFGAGVVPTPAQIIAASTQVIRGVGAAGPPNSRTTAGDLSLTFFVPGTPPAMLPNQKFWFLITPTAVTSMASTPSIANDVPISGVSVDTIGRAISLWTNRTPLAPTITAPSSSVVTTSGNEVELVIKPNDPDAVSTFPGDIGPNDFSDVAGVQVQYAAVPTLADPTPGWSDLPIGAFDGADLRAGWYIEDALDSANRATSPGARQFWLTRRLSIVCGGAAIQQNKGLLPSGDWQIRVRTFDYGHPFPDSTNTNPSITGAFPLNDSTQSYTASNYPAANTSPWSTPVRISVSAQVPPPILLSPINNTAAIVTAPLTLTWQYRNTYSPPFAQMIREVQIRKVGDEAWTTLASGASASESLLVTGFDVVSGNQYEWRVRVTDTSGIESEWSESGYFWSVPEPASGGVIPEPSVILDGATLGCGTHRVFIYRRGGMERVGEITNIESVQWGRVRDDISTARIVITDWDIDCGNLLANVESWAYEIVIFRDNGFSVDRVWEGPITLPTYENDKVTIQAKDVMAYLYRRIIKQAFNDNGNSPTAGDTVTSRAARIVLNAMAPDDPNIIEYLRVLSQPDDAKQYRSVPPYSRTAFEEIDDMAANAGLDYTAVGRAILLWGTKHRIGTLPEFTDANLGASPIVSEYGMSMANRYAVSDGNGVYGEATRLDENGRDEKYGLVEMLSSTWASETDAETGTYTPEGLDTIRESFAESSERSISERYPPPVVVRVPDNTRVLPDTVLSIQHLVPGVVIPLRSNSTLRKVVASQKLDQVNVTETAGVETITLTMSPFSRDDTEVVEAE